MEISVKDWWRIEQKGGPGSGNFGHSGRSDLFFWEDLLNEPPEPFTNEELALWDKAINQKSLGLSAIFKGGVGSGIRGHRTLRPGSKLPPHLANLKIPPAWTKVTYNPDPKGALLVKGFDSKGRPQSIYSEEFKKQGADAKFSRVNELAKKFDSITKENNKNMQSKDPEISEAASVMQLIMHTGVRPGSDIDTGAKVKAYGATTLEGRHLQVDKDNNVSLDFIGKKGVALSIPITDKTIAISLLKRAKTSGTNGKLFNVDENQLLNYTRSLDGGKFKTKDFRTFLGTKTAIDKVKEYGDKIPKSIKEYKQMVKDVAITVSKQLGNTPTIALQAYINPTVFSGWQGAF